MRNDFTIYFRYFLALLTTYAKQTEPDLESVLVKIKHLKGNNFCSQNQKTN